MPHSASIIRGSVDEGGRRQLFPIPSDHVLDARQWYGHLHRIPSILAIFHEKSWYLATSVNHAAPGVLTIHSAHNHR